MAECNLCGFPVGSDGCNAQHFTAEEIHEMQTAPVKRRLSSAERAARQMAVGILRAVDSGLLDSRSMAADGLLSWADMHFNVSDGSGIKKLRDEETKISGDHAPVPVKKRSDFIRGYCCAVSVLLRENGRNTLTDSLLRQCGSPQDIIASADESDQMEFRKAGMLP